MKFIPSNNNKKIDDLTETTNQLTNQGQIKGQIILTQAECDALPSSKETDGIIYMIRG